MTEQSIGFKIVKDEWLTEDGEPADQTSGTHRRILEVNMNKGDVSAVNYGANANTSGGFRALAELRDGRLTDDTLTAPARSLLADTTYEIDIEAPAPDPLLAAYVSLWDMRRES
jgi:hypothetical protein